MKNRAVRCNDGFYAGLCPRPGCEHFDGKKTAKAAQRGIVHDAWGRGGRRPKDEPEEEEETPDDPK